MSLLCYESQKLPRELKLLVHYLCKRDLTPKSTGIYLPKRGFKTAKYGAELLFAAVFPVVWDLNAGSMP